MLLQLYLNDNILKLRAIENWDGALPKVIGTGKEGQIFNMQDLIQSDTQKTKEAKAIKIGSQSITLKKEQTRERESD